MCFNFENCGAGVRNNGEGMFQQTGIERDIYHTFHCGGFLLEQGAIPVEGDSIRCRSRAGGDSYETEADYCDSGT